MNTKLTTIIAITIIAFAIIFGALVYDKMPDQVASHWNEKGEVDDYTSKFWGVFLMPIISIFLLALFLLVPHLDPLKENIAEFRNIFNLFILLMLVFLVYIWKLIIFWNLGFTFDMTSAILPAIGFLFIFIGYMLGKAKRNWFIGIRTPWTLSSDTVWDKTHQLAGKLFIASGILAMLGIFFGDNAVWFTLVPVLGTTLCLFIYSYLLYQKEIS
ncbi:MAG: SdpI family protein [Anaerolineae bacterium]|jgi:uncharacterized membrane protein|nr:SdpI family protein [Anaerolineae bacterium]MBT7073335.1 SdpI family protein [Anaerolineae bacterium]MBT7783665.1 SdpI family protein [Anaerolineae bacterium]